jgi:hypothetical protein
MNMKRISLFPVLFCAAALGLVMGAALVRHRSKPPLELQFLRYTNDPSGGLAAVLEIRNRGGVRVARNACRVAPEPGGEKGFWYAAEVPSRRLEPGEREEILVGFRPGPMTRWRLSALYARNPTDLEFDLRRFAQWLGERGLPLSRIREAIEARSRGQVSTEWIWAPSAANGS